MNIAEKACKYAKKVAYDKFCCRSVHVTHIGQTHYQSSFNPPPSYEKRNNLSNIYARHEYEKPSEVAPPVLIGYHGDLLFFFKKLDHNTHIFIIRQFETH